MKETKDAINKVLEGTNVRDVLMDSNKLNENEGDSDREWYKRYYDSLNGAKINKYVGMSVGGFPTFYIEFSDGTPGKIEISSDEEGNDRGFIFGLPQPK